MSRSPNSYESRPLPLRTTPHVLRYLELLVETGIFGKTPAEVAEELVRRGIQDLLDRKRIPELPDQERRRISKRT